MMLLCTEKAQPRVTLNMSAKPALMISALWIRQPVMVIQYRLGLSLPIEQLIRTLPHSHVFRLVLRFNIRAGTTVSIVTALWAQTPIPYKKLET